MAMKSEPPEKPVQGNAAKYYSYREAWTRIPLAIEAGFPFEAIAILESIMFDRITSYLTKEGPKSKKGKNYESFANLIGRWCKHHSEPVEHKGYTDLRVEVDRWRVARNNAVHGIVKSPEDATTDRIDTFVSTAVTTANEGVLLAKALANWCDNMERARRKTAQLNAEPKT